MPEFILGIDFGSKRIGLALGQSLTNTASSLITIKNNPSFWQEFESIIEQWGIHTVVVGLPLNMGGEEQLITRQTKNFAKKLQKNFKLNIIFHDERLSSFAAERSFQNKRQNKIAKAKDKSKLDAMAAQIILQSWLNEHTDSSL